MATIGMSFEGHLGFVEEATFGTPGTVDTYLGILSEGFSVDEGEHKPDTIWGDSEQMDVIPTLRTVSGNIAFQAYGGAAMLWPLKWASRTYANEALPSSVLAAPTLAISGVVGPASGTYYYKVTRILQHTASGLLFHTNPSPESASQALNGSQGCAVTWVNPLAGTIPDGFTAWGTGVWRTAADAGPGNEFLLTFVTAAGTTTYLDDNSSTLGTAAPPTALTLHRFQPSTDQPKSFTAEVHHANGASHVYEGCKINTLGLSVTPGEPVQMSLDVMAQDVVKDITPSSPAFSVTQPFMGYATYAYIQTAGAALAQNTLCNQFAVSLANNMAGQNNLDGTRVVSRINAGRRMVTGSLGLEFENNTQFDYFLANTEMALQYSLFGPPTTAASTATIGANTVESWPYVLEFHIPRVFYNTHAANISGQAKVVQNLNYSAKKDTTAGYALEIRSVATTSDLPDAS